MKDKPIGEKNAIDFIEVENAIKISTQEEKSIDYNMPECDLLLSDSLQGDFILSLEKPYQNIEDLMNNPDKELTNYLSLNMADVQTPILKHKNKVLVIEGYSDGVVSGSNAYVLKLQEPKKLMVKIIYKTSLVSGYKSNNFNCLSSPGLIDL